MTKGWRPSLEPVLEDIAEDVGKDLDAVLDTILRALSLSRGSVKMAVVNVPRA